MKSQSNPTRNLRRFAAATAVFSGLLVASAPAALADEALADLVEEVAPSVVTVLSSRDPTLSTAFTEEMDRLPFPEGSPFEEFLKGFGQKQGVPEQFRYRQPTEGLGSGFIMDAEGWIITNHHVVEGADIVTVRLGDDREFEAEIIGTDEATDLALLRIDGNGDLPHVELGDSDEIRVGEDVMAVGNPFGLGGTVTKGIVSAKGRMIGDGPYADFLQTDAAINKGNSGGPLFNMEGEVIGVNSAIYSPTGGSGGVGFAVSSNIVELIVEDLMDDGRVERGWIGVSIQDVTPDLAAALGLDEPQGALVASILEGGPSHGILKTGDVILEFDGEDVFNSRELPKLVAAVEAGKTIDIVVLRNGDEQVVNVAVGLHQKELAAELTAPNETRDAVFESLGATVAVLNASARQEVGVEQDVEGLVVTSVSATGPAAKAGLQVGDVIVRLGDKYIRTTEAFGQALETVKTDPALLLINRSGQTIFVAVQIA